MATVAPAESIPSQGIVKVEWSGMATGDTITAFQPKWAHPVSGSIQFSGTFGGATVTLEGSNDGTNYATLKDMVGAPISMTSAGIVEFTSTVQHVRPAISGGTGDSVTATVVMR